MRRSADPVSLSAAEQVLDLKGGSARGEVGPARLAAHRSRSTCDAEVAHCHRRPARVDICSPCRRCARCAPGVLGCRDGPHSVVEHPHVLDIRQRDPRVHRRPRGCALYSRTAWLVPSGRRRPAFRARRHRAAVAPKALTASLLKPSGTDLFEDPFKGPFYTGKSRVIFAVIGNFFARK